VIRSISKLAAAHGSQYLQTDPAINPSDSGGALLNRRGGLIGINVSRIEPPAGRPVQGIAFAIPINLAATTLRRLEQEMR